MFISVLLAGLGLITTVLDLPPVLRLSVQRILKTIAILVWSLVMMRMVTLILEQLGRLRDRFAMIKQETVILFSNLARVLIFGGAVYFVFLSWNIDVTAWMASAGIVGIAIGFAAKDTLANLFGGVFILARRSLQGRRLHQSRPRRARHGDSDWSAYHSPTDPG